MRYLVTLLLICSQYCFSADEGIIEAAASSSLVEAVAENNKAELQDPSVAADKKITDASLQDKTSNNLLQQSALSAKQSLSELDKPAVINSSSILTMMLSLLLVVFLIVGLAWLMKRMGGSSLIGGQTMKVVSSLSLGAREKIMLVEIGGEQLLLGVAPGRVSHLKSFSEPVLQTEQAGSEFSNKLKELLGDRNSQGVVNE